MKHWIFRLLIAVALVLQPLPSYAATYQIRILTSAALPDTTGNVWFEPAALSQTNDRYPQLITRYKDSGTKVCIGTNYTVPQNYTGAGTFVVLWVSTATTGAIVWDVDYTSISASGETFDPNSDQEALTVTTTTAGTSQIGSSSSVAATAANFVAGDLVQANICRDGLDASDTLAADGVVYAIIFQYTGS